MDNKRVTSVSTFAITFILLALSVQIPELFSLDSGFMSYAFLLFVISALWLANDIQKSAEKRRYHKHPLGYFFTEVKLEHNGRYPDFADTKRKKRRGVYEIKMPIGLSSEDFEKKKLALEQYLNKNITMKFNDDTGYLDITETPRNKKATNR